MTTFSELGLAPELLRAVADSSYTTPTPIQAQAIPVALTGADLIGCAQTGTGKTAGFLLPTLQRLATGTRGRVRALVLSPTRELAAQIAESARVYGKHLPLRSVAVFGGVGMFPQTQALRRGVDLIIATPGRLLDHMEQGHVNFTGLEVLVLDEADRMLDMGFLPDVKRILKALPRQRQTLLFSATMPPEIESMIRETMRSPTLIQIGQRSKPLDAVRQVVHPVDPSRKNDLLEHLLKRDGMNQVLVFTRTKIRADRVAKFLDRCGHRVVALHGNKSQSQRVQALNQFKHGKVDVLVATDIAARGLDVDGISHVINYDIPNIPEDYVHRIGRTARAEATGDAISLVSQEEASFIHKIERLTGVKIAREPIAGFEPNLHRAVGPPPGPMPRHGHSGQRPGGHGPWGQRSGGGPRHGGQGGHRPGGHANAGQHRFGPPGARRNQQRQGHQSSGHSHSNGR